MAIASLLFVLLLCTSYTLCIYGGIVSSGFIHLTTLIWLICTLPILSWNTRQVIDSNSRSLIEVVNLIFYSINTLLSIISLIILSIPDIQSSGDYRRLDDKPPCPFMECSALQNILFSYAGRLLRKSFSHPLTISDDYWQLEKRS